MANERDSQSLQSKVIKILRITNEPLSANAISELYGLSYTGVKKILEQLESDNLVYSLKTERGSFYFLPDKYLKRRHDLVESDEVLPYIWYEELSTNELNSRKEKIIQTLKNLQSKYETKVITATEYFENYSKKNEELAIINQIIADRIEKQNKECFYCHALLPKEIIQCPVCKKDLPKCSVCKRTIFSDEDIVKCPSCNSLSHEIHLREWLKSIGTCPICKVKLTEKYLQKVNSKE